VTIVMVHNWYQTPGGEDRLYRAESELLEAHGHRIIRFTDDNARIRRLGRLTLARSTLWNFAAAARLRALVARERAAVVHFHNTFPLLSASVLRAARRAGAAVVQTLHNFRLICPNGLLYRAGAPCEDCVERNLPWPGVVRSCYRGSRAATALAAAAVLARRFTGAWHDGIDAYIVLSDFARSVFQRAGFPEEKLKVHPNFVYPDPGVGHGRGGYVLFVGRLSEEKGVAVLVAAWKRLKAPAVLEIVGDGPLAPRLRSAAQSAPIRWTGSLPHAEVLARLRGASLLVAPSLCYEGSPLAVLESLAAGTPVVASRIGSLPEIIEPERTGWLAPPGDVAGLADVLAHALSDCSRLARMRQEARRQYEERYTAESHYQALTRLYEQVACHG